MDDDIDKKYGCWSLLNAPEHNNNILSYLSPRDIYNLGGAIPIVKKSIPMKTAIQSAMFQGGHARKSVETLYRLVLRQCIIVPFAGRVICLCTSKKCEMCFNKQRCENGNTNHYTNIWYGVVLCYKCFECQRDHPGVIRVWQKTKDRYLAYPKGFDCILSHPKVLAYGYGFRDFFDTMNHVALHQYDGIFG